MNTFPLPLVRKKHQENKHLVMTWYVIITLEAFIASILLAEIWIKIQP